MTTETLRIPAAKVEAGDFLVRVDTIPRSRVWEAPVNAKVLTASWTVHEGRVTLTLDTGYDTTVNLPLERMVEVEREVPEW